MSRLAAHAWLLLRRGAESLQAQTGTRDAAQVAFYVLMSFPAALLLVVWGLSTLLDDPSVNADVVDAIVDALPLSEDSGAEEVENLLDDIASGAGALGFVGAISLLYSASGAIAALRHSVNQAWGVEDRPFVPGKALDLGLTLAIVPLALAGLGLTLLGSVPGALGEAPVLEGLFAFLVEALAPAALIFIALCALYRLLPAERASMRAAWPGALAGLVGLGLVLAGMTIYFEIVGDAGAVYGAIGALLAVSFSTYVAAIAVIYGAHVAAVASTFTGAKAMDRELKADAEGESRPFGRVVTDALKGLVVRKR